MGFDFFKKKNTPDGSVKGDDDAPGKPNRYHLYSNASNSYPAMRFSTQKQAIETSKKIFKGSHCRIVDAKTGSALVTGSDVCAFFPSSFLAGIDITSKVTPRPQFMNDLHARIPQLTTPTYCWHNSFLTILNLTKGHSDLRYALTLIYHPDAGVEGHAIIEHNGQFYDPTLEHQGDIQKLTSYRLLEIIETCDLISYINEHHGPDGFKEMSNGTREWPNFRVGASGDRVFDL